MTGKYRYTEGKADLSQIRTEIPTPLKHALRKLPPGFLVAVMHFKPPLEAEELEAFCPALARMIAASHNDLEEITVVAPVEGAEEETPPLLA